jgi:uncharacterized Rmd1/YagE family protein
MQGKVLPQRYKTEVACNKIILRNTDTKEEKKWTKGPERKKKVEKDTERDRQKVVRRCTAYGGQENYEISKQIHIVERRREKNWCDDGKNG